MKTRRLIAVLIMLLVLCLFPTAAQADLGPKSSLNINVVNAPSELYYLDLLVTAEADPKADYSPGSYDETMYRLLWDYNDNGYTAAITHRVWPHFYGSLTTNRFVNVPREFKIIIVTQGGDIRVSEVYRRYRFSDTMMLNANTMEITVLGRSVVWDWVLQFLQTFGATIVIEGIILLLFGFRLQDNWKLFLLVNLITQLVLIMSLGLIMVFLSWVEYLFLFGLIEAAIIVAESRIYRKRLRREKPYGRVAYAVTANIISLGFTFFYVLISWLS